MKQLLRSSILLCAFLVASLGAVAQMTVDVTVNQHVSCPGGDDARLTIVVSNGPLEPMSVLVWNTTREKYEFIPIVGPSATIVLPDDGEDPVQSGSFIVFVSGPSGSATADPFEIFQPDDLIVNTINPTCGVPTGTIEFTSPTNDKGIYTFQYSIDDGTTYQSSPSFPGLTSGDYDLRVEISSHTSCELTAVESINPPPAPPDEPVLNPTQPDCDEPTGSIEVLSPIDPDFEYAINIMGPWQDVTTFSGLAADNIYTIFVRRKSDNSCLNSKSVSINPAPSTPPAPTVTTADATCGVGGTIEVTAPLGAQYTYSINGVDYQANPLFSDVPAGTYNVTANEGGCISDPTTVTINPPAAAPEIDNVTHSDPTTVGGIEGSITVNLLGGTGTPDFTYYLTGSSSANSGEISASSYTFTGLGAGTYTVYVTDAASCTSASITDIILEDPIICTDAEIVLTSGNDNQTICEGEALENIVYSINGDFGDVSVAGLPAGVSGSLSVTTYTISGTPTETGIFNYTVTATGSGSCSGDMVSGTVIISEPLDPEFDPLGPYCVGEPADVLPAVSNNGVIGSWSPATISTATAGVTNYTFTPDAGQCATTKIISITVNTTPTNVDAGPDVSICEGESTQLQGSADLPSNNNVLLSQDFTGVSVFGLPAGWSRSNSLWGGMNTSYAGGSAPELSLLSDGSTNNDVYRVVTPLINAIDNQFLDLNFIHAVDHFNGAYRVAVQTSTDGVNWTNRWEFYWPASAGGDILPESVNVDLSVMDDESFYIAFTYTGRLFNIGYWAIDNVELTGLFAEPVSVLWTPSTGLSDPTILKPIASPTETTTYTLTIGIGGCENSDQVTVTVVDNVIPTFSLDPEYTYCEGDSPVILPETSDNGISGTWSPSVISTETIGLTTYTFTPNPGECAYETSIDVLVKELPTATMSGGGDYCEGADPTGVDVQIDLTGEGPWLVRIDVDGDERDIVALSTPHTISNVGEGHFTMISVQDANCIGTVSGEAFVNEIPAPTATISGGGDYCAGTTPTGVNVIVDLTGTAPWSLVYAIDGVDQPAVTGINTSPYTIANAPAGEYTISSVEDATGCIGTGIGLATVIEHELPHAIMSGGGSYCAGADPTGVDVQIDLTGEGPWLVRIAVDGDERNILALSTPHIINDVGEGHFTIISVTDANCTGTVEGEAFVIELPLPEATISGGGEYCAGTDPTGVDVQINFSGIGPWDVIYAIDGVDQPEITGITTSPYTISNATAGVYTLTSVSDENCDGTVSGSATIIENSLPTAEISGGGSYCAGTDPTGINLTLDLTGVGPWTVVYAIDGLSQPALIDISASPYVLTDVTAGDYTLVSVIDANCTGTVSGLAEVVENPLPTAEISGGGSYCAGTTPTGVDVTIDLTGEGPWTVVYAIDGASQPALIDILTSPYILADATEGEYTLVSVVDANCIGTVNGNATVVENPLPTATMSGGGSYCAGTDPTNVDVSIELTGTGPWTVIYAVDGLPNVVSGIDATPYVISDATKGEYTMIGVEDAFCSGTVSGSASVIEFEIPTALMSGGGEYCKGADPTGVDVRVDFTGTAPWSYTFSADGDVRTLFTLTSPVIFNDVGEGYFVMLDVTDANCTGTVSGDALVVEIETAPPTGEANQEFCAGATIADIVVTGEAIAWYDSPGGSILADDYVLVDGETYYATQTAEGCESLDNLAVTVTVYDEIIVSVPVVTDATCAGEPTGQVTVSASGGIGPYTFTLYNGIGDLLASLSDGLAATFNDVPAGTDFYIAIVDDIGCGPIESARFDVNEPDPIQIDINSIVVTDAICFGQESGTISLSASGGTGDLYFTLTSGGVAIGATQVGSGVFTNLAPGSYIVEISDDQGCGPVLSEELIVGEADPFTIELITDGNGNISIVTDGGTPPFNFDLQFFDGTTWVDVASSTDPEFNGLAEGDYRVIATDDNGCTDTKEITILLYSFTLTATDITCFGEVDGTIRVNEVGVTTDPYSLDERKWFNEFSEDISTYMMDRYDNTEGLYMGLEAGTYTLIGTKGGASHTETVIIIEPQALSVTYAIIFDDVCSPSEAEISFTITGGTTADGFYNISWADGAFTLRDNLVPNLDEGTYVFVISDDNECSYTLEVEITFPEKLEIESILEPLSCNGNESGKITVNATGTEPLTYKLDGPDSYSVEDNVGIFENLAPGEYTLTVTDANNCSVIEVYTITEPEPLIFTLISDLDPVTLPCHDSTVDIEVTDINGGTGSYTILVNGEDFGSTNLNNMGVGSYEVNVRDENYCYADPVNLVVDGPKKPKYIDEVNLPRCRELALGKVDVGSVKITGVASGGNGDIADYNVRWYNMSTGNFIKETGITGEITGLRPGTYEARVQYPPYNDQEEFCTDRKTYELEVNSDYIFSVEITGAEALWCYGTTDMLSIRVDNQITLDIDSVYWENETDKIKKSYNDYTPFVVENIDGNKAITVTIITKDGCKEEDSQEVAIYDRIYPFIDRDIHPFFSDSDLDAFRIIDGDRKSDGDSTVVTVLANTEYSIEMFTKNPDYDLSFSWSPADFFNPTDKKTSVIMFSSGAYENYLTGSITNTNNNNKVEQYIPIVGLAQSQYGCIEEVNLKARILDRIRTSNVFSPNDDGINDIWVIPYSDIFPDLEIKIFNRWGHQVWSAKGTDAARGWNGRNRNGKELPTGTYYYVIKFNVDGTTKWKPVSGSVTIIR